jgi:carboxyl-terminal processing protease
MKSVWRIACRLAAVWVASAGLAWSQAPDAPPADAPPAAQQPAVPADSSAGGLTPPQGDEPPLPADDEYYELFRVLADTLDQVERNYVKEIDRRRLMEAAIRGILQELDPYSNYIKPEEMQEFKTSVEQQFGGIGIQITMEGGQLKVLSPLVGTPAYRAGIQAGDWIVAIEGESTEGISLDEAVRRLKGEAGTSVTITIARPASDYKETITLQREIIHIETVLGDRRKEDDSWDFMYDPQRRIGYVRLTAFSRETPQELKRALEELKAQGVRGLVLDLRFNPGGLLSSAIEVADLFVKEGRIVSTAGRSSPERTWDAVAEGTYDGFPMAVLVNRYSASASEIVAACLQDHKRAVIVGERTWGKGSVQNVVELGGGASALKLTTAGYKRPNGHNIHREEGAGEDQEWGVMPDPGYEVKFSDEETRQFLRYRRQRDLLLVNHYRRPDTQQTDPPQNRPSPQGEPQENQPQDGQPQGNQPQDAQPEDGQPPAGADSPSPDAPPAAEPGEAEAGAVASFSDRQLQKALNYLTQELAKAP